LTDMPNGLHNLTVYAKYTKGSIGASEIVHFSVEVPEPFPIVTVIAASVAALIIAAGLLVYFKKRKSVN